MKSIMDYDLMYDMLSNLARELHFVSLVEEEWKLHIKLLLNTRDVLINMQFVTLVGDAAYCAIVTHGKSAHSLASSVSDDVKQALNAARAVQQKRTSLSTLRATGGSARRGLDVLLRRLRARHKRQRHVPFVYL